MMRPTILLLTLTAIGAMSEIAAVEAETPMDIVAAQIRSQGYECDSPQSAKRNAKASQPNETVWLLVCENASYRVTLTPDMAAKVETVKDDDSDNNNDDGDAAQDASNSD